MRPIAISLSPSAQWRLKIYDELTSTNDHIRALASAGEPEYLAVMARRQTAGRGSRGRNWESPPGNLAISVLLRPTERARDVGQWALLAGVALAEALDATPGGRLTLKWPNDLLYDGNKLAGILVEAEPDHASGIAWVILGLGVNLATAPALADRETAVLDGAASPETVAWRVLERIYAWRQERRHGGFAPIRARWLRLAQPLGTAMTVKLPRGEIAGAFAGLNEDGNLLLQTPNGRVQAVVAGEIWTQPSPKDGEPQP